MAGWEQINRGDFGFEGRLCVTKYGEPQNISAYGTLHYTLKSRRTGVTKTVDAEFLTDGSDGWLTYTFLEGDIDASGEWWVRASVSGSGTRLTSQWLKFNVIP